ncbi:hypothetical protein M422DRAFT_45549 [Sphaerobolus stellatus SS14]|uniref:DH domain-containing protein n=1 Tax=Sphaerobolus stellatus (strain SS14) TaxID=990650 RepID=A0A0C9W4J5_SPHS4|nr:hypothetical protein M422DRAFT_45549 [Sphaerobolus stellatus SS14]
MNRQTETSAWNHPLVIDIVDDDLLDDLGYDWSPPPHGSFLGQDGSLASPVTVDQAFMSSKYLPEASPIGTETPVDWSADVYTEGLKRLSRVADSMVVEDKIRGGAVQSADNGLEAEVQESLRYFRPPTPSPPKVSNLPSVAEVPPLPTRSLPRTSRTSPSSLPPILKRANTMRSPAPRPIYVEPARPKSSHAHSDSERTGPQKMTGEFEFEQNPVGVPGSSSTPPTRKRRPSKPIMRKLSSSRSATPINEARTAIVEVWESPEDDHAQLNIPGLRPRPPTPASATSSHQYSADVNSPGMPYSGSSTTPQFSVAQQAILATRVTPSYTSASRARSRSVSAGRPGTPPAPPRLPSTASMALPDEYMPDSFSPGPQLPPATPPRSFARPPKSSAYPDPAGFPTPPSYPPVPGLVASGSTSTSTRSSAYTSPGTTIPLSSSDLSAVGFGLAGRDDVYHAHAHDDDGDHVVAGMGAGTTVGGDKALPSLPRTTSYTPSTSASESNITRLQLAANAAAQSVANSGPSNINTRPWAGSEVYASSTRSASSYEGSPVPLSRNASVVEPSNMGTPNATTLWRSEDEYEDDNDMDPEEQPPGVAPSTSTSFSYQRPRLRTLGSSRSGSTSGLTSASEDETDADDYGFLKEIEEAADEEVRTAAIVVAEEGRGLIIHGEGMDVSAVEIQPGTTHLLLSSSSTPHSIPGLLSQTLPNISATLLALDISANFLGALPPALAACTQLTELNVASNPLRALPVWLSNLEQLRVLIADATGISSLPVEFAGLKALNVLSIRRNKLVSLPPWLAYLTELERLEVEGNPFQGPWKALTAPLVAIRASNTTPQPQSHAPTQPPSIYASSTSDVGSVYGPGMSLYGDSVYSQLPLTPGSSFHIPRVPGSEDFDSSNLNIVNGISSGGRKFVNDEEDHTIMPRRSLHASSSQVSFTTLPPVPLTPSQFPLPTTPLTPAMSPPSATPSNQSFASSINSAINSPSQLPYMARSPSRPESDHSVDRQEGSSTLHRVPTFSSISDRRTPSPYLRPLSRTRTTPSRPTRMSGGSIATFVADSGNGERSRTSSIASQQRPHTDYVSRYNKTSDSAVEDSGYYGAVNISDYSSYRRSDGSEFLSNAYDQASTQDEERKKEIRRMRSADELRRALEPIIGPSEPLAPPEEDDNGGSATETDRRPPFTIPNVPRIDMRPGMKQSFTTSDAATISPGKTIQPTERPPAKRYASLGPTTLVTPRARPTLIENMWDNGGDVDADAEGDSGNVTLRKSRPPSPNPDEAQQPRTKSKRWGFFKKMSMGRIRPDSSGSGKPSRSVSGSTQTSPQGFGSVSRAAGIMPPTIVANTAPSSPTPHARYQSPNILSTNLTTQSLSTSPVTPVSATSRSPATLGLPQSRAARRRSFLPLDGPPALNIPIPRTSPFLPDSLIISDDVDDNARNVITPILEKPPAHIPEPTSAPPLSATISSSLATMPASPMDQQRTQDGPDEHHAQHARALRGIMAYLRDMVDLGMANSAAPPSLPSAASSTVSVAETPGPEVKSRRPTIVENAPRVMSEASLTSSTGSSSLRSDEQRTNTMSVVTTESEGSAGGKAEEERSRYKDDKARRAALIKEIVETERTYAQGLQELIDIYVKPASQLVNTIGNAVAGTKETVIPSAERKIVFNGVDSLHSFHSQSFLPALEKATRPLMMELARPDADISGDVSMAAALAVANVFVSHAAFMRMYSTYVNNFDNAVARLKTWAHDPRRSPGAVLSPSSSTAHLAGMVMSVVNVPTPEDPISSSGLPTITSSQRKRIKQFLKRARLNPKHSQINLESYLLLPVQRIPRYRLLLEELVRCTPPKLDMPDGPIDRALSEIASLANNMNEGKRESESRRRLVQWQSRIKGKFPSPLVQPHRRLIMDGPLNLRRVVRKSSMAFDVINPEGTTMSLQVDCLAPEDTPRSLVGVLCNDLLVLCKDPSEGKDKNGPVDLWAVLRMQTLPTPASISNGNLRVVDNKAILYFDVPSISSADALTWCRAINMNVATKP